MKNHSSNSVTISERIDFHNVTETELQADGGLALFRVPRSVRDTLSSLGRMVAEDSAGIEIRFVTDAPAFRPMSIMPRRSCFSAGRLSIRSTGSSRAA
jgi:hypothetical protein